MIMPKDQPQDEGLPVFPSLDALNRHLQQRMAEYNTAPQDELGGLSPEQVARLIYTDWTIKGMKKGTVSHPEPPWAGGLFLDPGIPLGDLADAMFFQNCRTFLFALREAGSLRATQTGNLPRAFVKAMRGKIKSRDPYDDQLDEYYKAMNETDFWALHETRIVCQCGGLIRRAKGSFSLTKKRESMLEDRRAGRLFAHLFYTYFRKFNTAYRDRLPDTPRLQWLAAFTLCRLGVVARDWTAVSDLPDLVLLPAVRDELSEMKMPHFEEADYVSFRILDPLVSFGLLDAQTVGILGRVQKMSSVRTTGLWDRLLEFRI